MRHSHVLLPGALALLPAAAAVNTIWLAGDSTEAKGGGGAGTEGWGQYLQYSFDSSKYVVNNKAVAGRSARSYWREGRFEALANEITAGDWVVIEFGHNDGGSLKPTDDGRSDCPGQGTEVCYSEYDGVNETIYTFPEYLIKASRLYQAKGAKVVLSSTTPDNPWESGTFEWTANRFQYYDSLATSELGGPAKGVYFVPHGDYAAQVEKNLGKAVVDENFPKDHTHTAPFLSNYVAGSFVLGLKCGTSGLGAAVKNTTASLTGTALGHCITYNSTITALL